MSKIIYSVIFFVGYIIISCSNDTTINFDCGEGKVYDCNECNEILNPVCGCDGVTYDNSCSANCMGVYEYTRGACN